MPKLNNGNLGKRYYNDGTKEYLLFPCDAENNPLLIKGRLKFSDETKKRISKTRKDKHIINDCNKGRIWVHYKYKNFLIKPYLLDAYLYNGYLIGRVISPEDLRRISDNARKKTLEINAKRSEEERQTIRDNRKKLESEHPEWRIQRTERFKSWYSQLSDFEIQQLQSKHHEGCVRNGSYGNVSKQESMVLEYIRASFPNYTIISQFRDENRYPFNCDFYIKELDLFIEWQGTWMHGGDYFNPNEPEHLHRLKEAEIKAKTSNQYKSFINTWTKSDIVKRDYIFDNKLNALIVYPNDNMTELITYRFENGYVQKIINR